MPNTRIGPFWIFRIRKRKVCVNREGPVTTPLQMIDEATVESKNELELKARVEIDVDEDGGGSTRRNPRVGIVINVFEAGDGEVFSGWMPGESYDGTSCEHNRVGLFGVHDLPLEPGEPVVGGAVDGSTSPFP